MPLYQYKCTGLDCQNEEELLTKFDDKPTCSKCNRELSREMSSTRINTWGCSAASKPFSH